MTARDTTLKLAKLLPEFIVTVVENKSKRKHPQIRIRKKGTELDETVTPNRALGTLAYFVQFMEGGEEIRQALAWKGPIPQKGMKGYHYMALHWLMT